MKTNRLLLALGLGGALWVAGAFALGGTGTLLLLAGPLVVLSIVHRPAWGLWLLVLALPVPPAFVDVTVPRTVNFALPALILGSWLLHALYRRRSPAPLPLSLSRWFLLFLAWTVISGCFAEFPGRGFGQASRYLVLALVLLAVVNLWTVRDLRRALMLYALVLVPLGIYGIWQIVSLGPEAAVFRRIDDPKRISSLYHNPNTLGVVMGNGLAVLLAYLLVPSSRKLDLKRGVELALVALAAFALIGGVAVSFSRSSYLYLAAIVITLSLCRPRLRWPVLAGAAAAGLALVLLPLPPILYGVLRLGAGTSYRDSLWLSGWSMLRDHPWTGLGAGTDVFEYFRQPYLNSEVAEALVPVKGGGAHNVFLTKGAELGWPGLILVLALFVVFWSRVPRALGRFRSGDWIQGAAAAGMVGLSVRAVFESGYTLGMGHVADSLNFFLFGLVLLAPTPGESVPRVAVPAREFREGRTGGQKLWERLVDRWRARGLPVVSEDEHPVPVPLRDHPFPLVFWYWRVYSRVRAGLLVVDQSDAGRLGLLLRAARRNPHLRLVLVVQHLREAFRYRHPLYVKLLRRNETVTLRLAHRVIVHTRQEAEAVIARGVRPERVTLIAVGVAPAESRGIVRSLSPAEPLRLLWIGGDFERKGLEKLLQAVSRCEDPRPTVSVVGRPHPPEILDRARRRVVELGLAETVAFLGWVSDADLDRLWDSHDVYVQPSLREGHGSALDEALVRGLPAVASDLPVFRERLGAADVLFVPAGDAPAWSAALTRLRDPGLRRRLAEAGRSRAAAFPGWSDTLDRYEAVVRSELEAVAPPGPWG